MKFPVRLLIALSFVLPLMGADFSAFQSVWRSTFDASGFDGAAALRLDANRNLFVAGQTESSDTRADGLLVKISASGARLWARRHNSAISEEDFFTDVAVDGAGNPTAVGFAAERDAINSLVVASYDGASGSNRWTRQIAGRHVTAATVAVDATGNVLVTAGLELTGQTTGFVVRTVKFNGTNGAPLWTNQIFGARDLTFELNSRIPMAAAADGGCYVATLISSVNGDLDWLLVRVRPNGAQQWSRTYGGADFDSQPLLGMDGVGNLLLSGSSGNAEGGLDLMTLKVDTAGTTIWTARVKGSGVFKFGSHVAAGVTGGLDGRVYVAGNSPGWGGFVLCLDGSGVFEWMTHLKGAALGLAPLAFGRSIVSTEEGLAWLESDGSILSFDAKWARGLPVADFNGGVYVAGSFSKENSPVEFGMYAEKLTVSRDSRAPRFVEVLPLYAGFANSTNVFEPVVNGSGLSFQWHRNGDAIPGMTNNALTVNGADLDTVGFFSLEVSNAFGVTISPDIELSTVSPFFITQPKSQTIVTGGDAAFTALAVGFETQMEIGEFFPGFLTYRWFKDGQELFGQVGSKLVLRRPGFFDVGNYWAVATLWMPQFNYTASVTSDRARLDFPVQSIAEIWREQFFYAGSPWTVPESVLIRSGNDVEVSLRTPNVLSRGNVVGGLAVRDVRESFGHAAYQFFQKSHIADSAGNFYAIGETNTLDTGMEWAVTRRTASGTGLWTNTVGSLGRVQDFVIDAGLDTNENLIITGWTAAEKTGRDILTVCLNKDDGRILWKAVFDDPTGARTPYYGEQASALGIDKSGNSYVSGYGLTGTNGYLLLLSYDRGGTNRFVFKQPMAIEPGEDFLTRLAVDDEGNAVVGGTFGLMRVDRNGRLLWTNNTATHDGTKLEIVGLQLDRAGNIFVATAGGVVAKFDAFGILIGAVDGRTQYPEHTFTPTGKMFLDDFGNVYVVGTGGITQMEKDILAMKFGPYMNRLWMARVDGVSENWDQGRDIQILGTNIYVTGWATYDNQIQASVARFGEPASVLTIKETQKSRTIRNGTSLRLEAAVTGQASFFQWYRNFLPISLATNRVVDIPRVAGSDEGFYHLEAMGPGPTFARSAGGGFAIRVADPPAIPGPPVSTNVFLNGQIRLAATVTGTAPLSYQWQLGGQAIAGATNLTLTIASAQFQNRGSYRLAVFNEWGGVTSAPAIVNISAPLNMMPIVRLAEPADRWVQKDLAPVRFRAEAYDPDGKVAKVAFRVNGAVVSNVTVAPFMMMWTPPGAGTFKVSAEAMDNLLATAVTPEVEVVVATRPTIISQPGATTNIAENADLILRTDATGTPKPRYQWRLNGVNIPGATNDTYVVGGAQVRDSGRYAVLVANEGAAAISSLTEVIVAAPTIVLTNRAADALLYTNAVFSARGNNLGATKDPTEVNHAGRRGGSSVWFRWRAPVRGVMSINTRGSAIDTLLAVYDGPLSAATSAFARARAADDERGGFHTSALRFNAVQGQEYFIVVDGFNAQRGNIVVSGALDSSARDLPQIDTEPVSKSTIDNGSVVYTVSAAGDDLSFQWYFNGYPLPGATASGIFIPNLKSVNVGDYVVRISNAGGVIESIEVELELGKADEPVTQDRVEDLFANGTATAGLRAAAIAGFPIVSPGTSYQKSFNTSGATTDSDEPVLGDGGGASKWYIINAGGNGTLVADTIGSEFPTTLTLHDVNDLENLPELAQGVQLANGASRLTFPAVNGQAYLFRVDGRDSRQGLVVLNVSIGAAPVILAQLTNQVIAQGQAANLGAGVTASPAASFQWYLNGFSLNGQNATNLQIVNFDPAQAGLYELEAANALGATRTTVGTLELAREVRFNSVTLEGNGAMQLHLEGNNRTYFIDYTSNFQVWSNIFTGQAVNGGLDYTPPVVTNLYRFYRARW